MDKYCLLFRKKNMASFETMVAIKQVKQIVPEEWNEGMPLPGDIIEGVAEEDSDEVFMSAKVKSELSSYLGRISREVEVIWVKVRRGGCILKIKAYIVMDSKGSRMNKRYTIRAVSDDRHVAVLGDLTWEQCNELQEMSRTLVNFSFKGFTTKGIKYDWNMKLGTYLPDNRCPVISSMLFLPLPNERSVESTTARSMAWFSAAVASGVPLIFVNIQTEQIVNMEKMNSTGQELSWSKQQNQSATVQVVQGIRIWYLPGVTEVLLELTPKLGETRFGMEIKRTEEGFIRISSVTKNSAADRTGLGHLCEEAIASEQSLTISRLERQSVTPSSVAPDGLINCCDQNELRDTLTLAIDQMESITLHIMAWPNLSMSPTTPRAIGTLALRPPTVFSPRTEMAQS